MPPSNHLIFCHPLLLLPSLFPSIRVFSNESVLRIRWPKNWNFSISPSNKYSGLISFKIDWLDPLEVQGTLKSLLQHCNSKASILQSSAFFMVQLSHPYMTTGKIKPLTIWTLFQQSDVSALQCTISVCHNFPSKEQVSFNFIVAVTVHSDIGAQENKIGHCFYFSPFCLP